LTNDGLLACVECPNEGTGVVSDAEDNRVRVVVNFTSCKNDEGRAVVDDDCDIFQAIDGDECVIGTVFEVQEHLLDNLFWE
jgi:hypothetical protein